MMIAMNIKTQPKVSLAVGISCSMTMPPRIANTDSRLIIIDAIVGFVYFCPMICSV